MSGKVLVVATKKGFYHGIRDVGTQFEVPTELVTDKTWFKAVELVEKPKTGRGTPPNKSAE
ncbi:hypothetical protein [Acinetobacter haemolyticus]|uniref:hypothetical protein n=1 Tax=Acinetobacter haemolyticus TaxID=29430 RepID=UPI001331FA41|nr:hypothetical protein [Acinetobacter haemolyticus]QHI17195.1 hypothetical protein AhaeAN4_11690 [Acinetobacter haemolyticus]